MSIFIPRALRQGLTEFGSEGAEWLDLLPARIAELERDWQFSAGPAFDHEGAVSWTAPVVLSDGSEAVLKIGYPHWEARMECEALRVWDGHGAARLLRSSVDGFTLLLERCRPGLDLWSLDREEADMVAIQLLPRLWRRLESSSPFMSLSVLAQHWIETAPTIVAETNYDESVVHRAVSRAEEVAATQPREVLLHGDFHPENVLAAERDPWLAIDPKPVYGEPAYDLAQWLYNRSAAALKCPDPVAEIREQVEQFAAELQLEPARITGWALVKSVGWRCGKVTVELFNELDRSYC